MISIIGSFASIIGLLVSLYVLYREVVISRQVDVLKGEEEAWHKGK
jgi:hypothetical protein